MSLLQSITKVRRIFGHKPIPQLIDYSEQELQAALNKKIKDRKEKEIQEQLNFPDHLITNLIDAFKRTVVNIDIPDSDFYIELHMQGSPVLFRRHSEIGRRELMEASTTYAELKWKQNDNLKAWQPIITQSLNNYQVHAICQIEPMRSQYRNIIDPISQKMNEATYAFLEYIYTETKVPYKRAWQEMTEQVYNVTNGEVDIHELPMSDFGYNLEELLYPETIQKPQTKEITQ